MKRPVKIKFRTSFKKAPDLQAVRQKINAAVKKAMHAARKDWSFDGRKQKFELSGGDDGGGCEYTTQLTFQPKGAKADWGKLLPELLKATKAAGWKPLDQGKVPVDNDDEDVRPPALVTPAVVAEPEELPVVLDAVAESPAAPPLPPEPPPINTEHKEFFAHIYERETQIAILYSSVMAAVNSNFYSRSHAVILGDPGCGKTEILRSFQAMLGDAHVVLLDGPSTTKAGIEQLIIQAQRIPSFLFVEELEKMPVSVSQVLLGLLDGRGEIRQTNAKAGHVQRDAKVLCVATVNDRPRFIEMNQGALSSRFSHEIYCPRPDRDLLHRIVLREVKATNGNPFWVAAAVNHCTHIENNYDPRRSIAVCLSGKDDLLDGAYQELLIRNRVLKDTTNEEMQELLKQVREARGPTTK